MLEKIEIHTEFPPFFLTWETVTDESAAQGNVESQGYMRPFRNGFGLICAEPVPFDMVPRYRISELYGFSLRESLDVLQNPMRPDGNPHSGSLLNIEASDSDVKSARWISFDYDRDLETGVFLSLSLNFPETVSGSSRARILRVLRS